MILRKSVIIYLFLLGISFSSFSQQLSALTDELNCGSVSLLNDYILHSEEIYSTEFVENNIYWRLYREILPGYYEGTLQVVFTKPYSEWRHKQFRQRVNILSKDSTIIYFQIIGLDTFDQYKTLIDSGMNRVLYAQFEQDYLKVYKRILEPRFLFIDSINFSERNNGNGDNTTEFDKMLHFVNDRDLTSLNNWLRCGNSELQLYAVKGFLLLKEKKQKIDEETCNLIYLVIHKKGNVNFFINSRERRIQMDKLRRDYLRDE